MSILYKEVINCILIKITHVKFNWNDGRLEYWKKKVRRHLIIPIFQPSITKLSIYISLKINTLLCFLN